MIDLWSIDRTGIFKKQFKRLNPTLQKKATNAVEELVSSEDPRRLGKYKKSLSVYAYELDKSNRLIYKVNFGEGVVFLARVGNHKQSYGSD